MSPLLDSLIILSANLLLGFPVAYFLGKKRKLGFRWSLFFCGFLSIIVGLIITLLSPKVHSSDLGPSNTKKNFGWFFIIVGGLGLFNALNDLMSQEIQASYAAPFLSIGILGLGLYLKEIGTGKQFTY